MRRNKRFLSLLLAVLVVFGGMPAAFGAAGIPSSRLAAPQDCVQALSQLVEANWSGDFFSVMTLTAGESEFAIDGEVTAIAAAPAIEDGEILLPREAVAELRDLPPEIALRSMQPLMTKNEAEALGLEVQTAPDSGGIFVTAPYQTRRLLVKTAKGKLDNTYGALVALPLTDNRFVLQYATEEQARSACLHLSGDLAVLYAEPDGILSANAKIGETAAVQAALSWGTGRIGSPAFQAVLPANPPAVRVAVLDTGLDVNHPLLAGRISSTRWNFVNNSGNVTDTEGHGTHVSGIVVDASSPNVLVMPLKVLDDEGRGAESVITEALRYAADHGAQVANLSLGSPSAASNYWGEALEYAKGKGVTVVAASGNDGTTAKNYPAAYPDVIAVSASTSSNYLAAYSNRGDWVDIGAPGTDIISTFPIGMAPGGLAMASGTSMAAPHASAAVALLLSYCPIPQEEILPYLVSLSDKWADSGDTSAYGAGIINLTPRGAGAFLPGQLSMKEGETTLLKAACCPPVPGQAFAFTSDNPAVAAVSPGGGVVALRPGTATVTATGPGGPLTVPVTVKGVASISIDNAPLGCSLDGTLFRSYPLKVYATYEDGSSNLVLESNRVTGDYLSGFVPGQRGWQTITVTYAGYTAQHTLWVDTRILLDMGVRYTPSSFYYGQDLDMGNAYLYTHFDDGNPVSEPLTADMIVGYNKFSYATQPLYVVWQGRVIEKFRFIVCANSINTAYYRDRTILTPANQTALPPLQPFNAQGGLVRIHFENLVTGGTFYEDVPMDELMKDLWQYDYFTSLYSDGTVAGNVPLFGISGAPRDFILKTPDPAAGITLDALPNKLNYSPGEVIDPTGGIVRFTAHDGSTFDYPLKAEWCSWGVSGTGTRTIDVTVRNYELGDTRNDSRKWAIRTSYEVTDPTAAPVTFSTLTLLSQPAKTAYLAGERLSTAGGKIRLGFSDGSTADLDLQPGYCSGFNPNRTGAQTVTVNLSGKTASFSVTVKARPKSISIVTLPSKLTYRVHEYVDLTGGAVQLTNPDGSTEILAMTSPRIEPLQLSGGAPGETGFDMVEIVCDGVASADFLIAYVNSSGYFDGVSGSETLIYKKDYIAFPAIDIPNVRWESSNGKILTLNANGTINFHGRGSTAVALVYEPPGHAKMTLGKIDVTVNYNLWQWILVIFLFGWIWL